MKLLIIFILNIFFLSCDDNNGYAKFFDYLCSKNGVEYIRDGHGLFVSYIPDGKIATCNP